MNVEREILEVDRQKLLNLKYSRTLNGAVDILWGLATETLWKFKNDYDGLNKEYRLTYIENFKEEFLKAVLKILDERERTEKKIENVERAKQWWSF